MIDGPFKLSAQYMQAHDWQAQDYSNLERSNVFSSPKAGTGPPIPTTMALTFLAMKQVQTSVRLEQQGLSR
jgi:hypothetical protein